ncbi:unnamed protein product, partial [Phaeothamnion confervicola]
VRLTIQINKIFREIDADSSGEVSRDELLAALETGHPGLLSFLKQTALDGINGGGNGGCGGAALSIFDAIEANDDENVTWDEFLRFFSGGGALDASGNNANRGSGGGGSGGDGDAAGGGGGGSSGGASAGTHTVEQCESEEDGRWREAWTGSAGEAVIKRLVPGGSYRFRVRAANADGLPGAWSDSVVVNTLLETPGVLGAVTATSVRLRWEAGGAARAGGGARNKERVDRMLAEWTRAGSGGAGGGGAAAGAGAASGGVSVEAVFSRYDVDGSGAIDVLELGNLLGDLGVEPTEERLRQAFADFDADRDGTISLDEF